MYRVKKIKLLVEEGAKRIQAEKDAAALKVKEEALKNLQEFLTHAKKHLE